MAVVIEFTVFEFTIDADGTFPNRIVDVPSFIDEIEASAIVPDLVSVTMVDGNCRIEFAADLSSSEIAILEALVLAHDADQANEVHMLPYIWQKKNPAAGQASTKMNVVGFDGSIDGYAVMRPTTATGMNIRLKNAITVGSLTITLTKNGVATTKDFTFNSTKGSRKLLLVTPGKFVFKKGDTIGVRWSSSADMLPAGDNEIDIAIEVMWQ